MKFFIDSGDIEEIKKAAAMGLFDGVTTNPALLAKSGKPMKKALEEICEIVDGPISGEVLSMDYESILREGREIAKIHKNIVVKVPLITEGLRAVKTFKDEGIRTNVTLCFSANRALLAAKAGASFISPFIGRIDDVARRDAPHRADHHGLPELRLYTEVLVASVSQPTCSSRPARCRHLHDPVQSHRAARLPPSPTSGSKFIEDGRRFRSAEPERAPSRSIGDTVPLVTIRNGPFDIARDGGAGRTGCFATRLADAGSPSPRLTTREIRAQPSVPASRSPDRRPRARDARRKRDGSAPRVGDEACSSPDGRGKAPPGRCPATSWSASKRPAAGARAGRKLSASLRALAHGLLHLIGYDHQTKAGRVRYETRRLCRAAGQTARRSSASLTSHRKTCESLALF
jgi:transaldolase